MAMLARGGGEQRPTREKENEFCQSPRPRSHSAFCFFFLWSRPPPSPPFAGVWSHLTAHAARVRRPSRRLKQRRGKGRRLPPPLPRMADAAARPRGRLPPEVNRCVESWPGFGGRGGDVAANTYVCVFLTPTPSPPLSLPLPASSTSATCPSTLRATKSTPCSASTGPFGRCGWGRPRTRKGRRTSCLKKFTTRKPRPTTCPGSTWGGGT